MKKTYLNLIYSISAGIIPIMGCFALFIHFGYKPLLTNSISFDAKIQYIAEKKVGQTDLMAIGSSITLNDLSSKVIKDSIAASYFNFSCWGLQINDTKQLLIKYLPKYQPKYVVICSSLPDFTTGGNAESIENYLNTADYFKEHCKEYFYIKNYSSFLDIITRKQEYAKHRHSTKDDYASLNFDQYGAVLLNISSANILPERWNETGGFPTNYTNKQYAELTLLSQLLKDKGVRMIFVQTPIRAAYINTPYCQQAVNTHFTTCKAIVEKYGGVYLNFHNTLVFSNNDMFVDQFHLSETGAMLFTREVAGKLKNIIQPQGLR